jgi:hypothetical protein
MHVGKTAIGETITNTEFQPDVGCGHHCTSGLTKIYIQSNIIQYHGLYLVLTYYLYHVNLLALPGNGR